MTEPGLRQVVFCCTANQIRSVFAARAATQLRLTPHWLGEIPILSRGTHAAPGISARPEAVRAARRLGINLDRHSSLPLTAEDMRDAWLLAMTNSHLENLPASADGTWRCELLGAYDGPGEIEDPIGLPESVYSGIFEVILECLHAWSRSPRPAAPASS